MKDNLSTQILYERFPNIETWAFRGKHLIQKKDYDKMVRAAKRIDEEVAMLFGTLKIER